MDLVLISHNHWDHTDRRFLRPLAGEVPVLAPRASAWLTRLKGAHNVLGLGKWERKDFGAISITAVPASHVAITRGFIVTAEGRNVYFAGDTYLGDFMKDIGEKYALDLALLPVASFRIPMTMGEKALCELLRCFDRGLSSRSISASFRALLCCAQAKARRASHSASETRG